MHLLAAVFKSQTNHFPDVRKMIKKRKMKEQKNIEIKVGMQLDYNGKIVTVKKVNETHVAIAYNEGGATFVVNKLGIERKHIVNQKS